jgi:hypothetical protein
LQEQVKSEEEQSAIFVRRFLRSYRLLHFIACRVLGDEERAPICRTELLANRISQSAAFLI